MDNETDKLKAMCAAIKDLLRAEDMVGCIIIQGPSKAEYCINLEASWTPMKHDGDGLRIKCMAASGGPEEKEKLKAMCGTLSAFMTIGEHIGEQFQEVLKMLGKSGISFTHTTRKIDHE